MTGSPQSPSDERRRRGGVVLVKGHEGMGNRILSLLGASLYARLAGRELLVDWRDGVYAEEGVNAFSNLFRSRFATSLSSSPVTESVTPWMWRGRLDWSANAMWGHHVPPSTPLGPFAGRVFSADVRTLDHPEEVVVIWSLTSFVSQLRPHLKGHWESLRRLDDAGIAARLFRDFDFHPAIVERAASIRAAWGGEPAVGVHVRNTDRRTNLSRLTNRLDAILARRPGCRLFLATDDKAIEALFSDLYPGMVTVPKWFATSGPLHKWGSGCPDRVAMGRDVLVEILLLAGCDDVVLDSDSTFAFLVKLLWRGNPRRMVDIRPLSWLPNGARDALWRSKAWLRWGWRLRALGMPLRPPCRSAAR